MSADGLDPELDFGAFLLSHYFQPHHFKSLVQKENVLFGQPFDEKRYWDALERSSLLPDLLVLPDGDLTEVCFQYSVTTRKSFT